MPNTYTFPNPLYISFTILCNRHWKCLAKSSDVPMQNLECLQQSFATKLNHCLNFPSINKQLIYYIPY